MRRNEDEEGGDEDIMNAFPNDTKCLMEYTAHAPSEGMDFLPIDEIPHETHGSPPEGMDFLPNASLFLQKALLWTVRSTTPVV